MNEIYLVTDEENIIDLGMPKINLSLQIYFHNNCDSSFNKYPHDRHYMGEPNSVTLLLVNLCKKQNL